MQLPKVLERLSTRAGSKLRLEDFAGLGRCSCYARDLLGSVHLVHSEGFREAADIVIDFNSNIIRPERRISQAAGKRALLRLAPDVPRGSVIHVKADHITFFFRELLPLLSQPVVLVSGESDWGGGVEFEDTLSSPMLHHWFVQNCNLRTRHEKVTPIPIGFDNAIFTKLEKRLGFFLMNVLAGHPFRSTLINELGDQLEFSKAHARAKPISSKPLDVLCTFHRFERLKKPDMADPRMKHRLDAFEALERNPCCTFMPKRLSQFDCWTIHERFAFEVSPHGNGMDCFRTWEALALGTIPIVRKSPLDVLYENEKLPVVMVEEWSEITKENLRKWHRDLSGGFERVMQRLSMDHWLEQVERRKKECRARSRE